MSVTRLSLAEILHEHVTLEVESIDRMYLNVYIPNLQPESGRELVSETATKIFSGIFCGNGARQALNIPDGCVISVIVGIVDSVYVES